MPCYKYGKPYDPALRTTACGEKLYTAWRRIRRHPHCKEWEYYPTFYEWSMNMGYELGAELCKLDEYGPFSAENCVWYMDREHICDEQWIADWNKAVNRIRKHYGMPPLEGTNYGD